MPTNGTGSILNTLYSSNNPRANLTAGINTYNTRMPTAPAYHSTHSFTTHTSATNSTAYRELKNMDTQTDESYLTTGRPVNNLTPVSQPYFLQFPYNTGAFGSKLKSLRELINAPDVCQAIANDASQQQLSPLPSMYPPVQPPSWTDLLAAQLTQPITQSTAASLMQPVTERTISTSFTSLHNLIAAAASSESMPTTTSSASTGSVDDRPADITRTQAAKKREKKNKQKASKQNKTSNLPAATVAMEPITDTTLTPLIMPKLTRQTAVHMLANTPPAGDDVYTQYNVRDSTPCDEASFLKHLFDTPNSFRMILGSTTAAATAQTSTIHRPYTYSSPYNTPSKFTPFLQGSSPLSAIENQSSHSGIVWGLDVLSTPLPQNNQLICLTPSDYAQSPCDHFDTYWHQQSPFSIEDAPPSSSAHTSASDHASHTTAAPEPTDQATPAKATTKETEENKERPSKRTRQDSPEADDNDNDDLDCSEQDIARYLISFSSSATKATSIKATDIHTELNNNEYHNSRRTPHQSNMTNRRSSSSNSTSVDISSHQPSTTSAFATPYKTRSTNRLATNADRNINNKIRGKSKIG